MLKFNVITLFPELFNPFIENLPLKRAIEKNLVQVNLVNLRDFAVDKRGTVDDKPYGGGTGMILMIEPIYKALESLPDKGSVLLMTPTGLRFNQDKARTLAKDSVITIICGRYEGIDARVDTFATDKVSVGNFILSGGELPALTIMESVVRLLPGILEKESALAEESFNEDKLEYPQYTRPEEFKGMKVPETLISGNHKQIADWRKKNSKIID